MAHGGADVFLVKEVHQGAVRHPAVHNDSRPGPGLNSADRCAELGDHPASRRAILWAVYSKFCDL